MTEEHLSPDMEASPRWWSEGLAVYLSEQWRYEDEFWKPAFDGITQNNIPGFRQIAVERKLAYDWGWTIVRFIEIAYGRKMILRVVKECADGNVFSVIGEEAAILENRWRNWILAKGRQTRDDSTSEITFEEGTLPASMSPSAKAMESDALIKPASETAGLYDF